MDCAGNNDERGKEGEEDAGNNPASSPPAAVETFVQSSSSNLSTPSTSGHSSGKEAKKTTLLSFFKRTQPEDISCYNIPTKKKKSVPKEPPQQICIKCGIKLSRTNAYYLDRHTKERHKNDPSYDARKAIVNIDSPKNPWRPKDDSNKRCDKLLPLAAAQSSADVDQLSPAPPSLPPPVPVPEDSVTTDIMEMQCFSQDSARPISPTHFPSASKPHPRTAHPVSLVDYVQKAPLIEAPTTDTSSNYAELCSMIQNLQVKIDQIATQHPSKTLQTSTYLMDTASTLRFREATSIAAVAALTPIVLEPIEDENTTRIYCSLCREAFGLEGRSQHGKINLSSRKFCSGFLEKNENLAIPHVPNKGNKSFYNLKKEIGLHLTGMGSSGDAHIEAHNCKQKGIETEMKNVDALENLVRASLTTIKMGGAGVQYETCLSLLSGAGANIGTLHHSRKQMEGFTDAIIGHCRLKLQQFLTTKLPSTGFFPHYNVACDKSTPGRESNHAVMLLAPYAGVRQAYPIGAPKVYSNEGGRLVGGTSEELAVQVIDTLVEFALIEPVNLSYLIANHSDGQYQSVGFQSELSKQCQATTAECQSRVHEFPVVWDGAHWLDLSIKTTKDKSSSSKFFKKFLDRANSFHDMFGSGRGFQEYKAVLEETNAKGVRLSGYSVTRFSSSAFDSLKALYSSYQALILAYEENRETKSDTDEMKFKIRGWDFALELCLVLDILQPIVSVMVLSQRVNQQIWSIVAWTEELLGVLRTMKADLEKLEHKEDLRDLPIARFPFTKKHANELLISTPECEHGTFQTMPLLEGWLVEKEEGGKNGIHWKLLEFEEIAVEITTLTTNLFENIKIRKDKCINGMASTLASCIAPIPIIKRLCGSRFGPTLRPIMGGGDEHQNKFKTEGRKAFRAFYGYVCKLPHVSLRQKSDGLLFDEDMADEVYSKYTELLYDMVWNTNSLLRKAFINLPTTTAKLVDLSFREQDQTSLQAPVFHFRFSDKSEAISEFDEDAFISAIYNDEEVYTKLGVESATTIDVAVAMGGCEAVVEGFYSTIKRHLSVGGLDNKTLVGRATVDWLMPSPLRCPATIRSIAKLYHKGHARMNLLPHRSVYHSDVRNRGKYSDMSKVMRRHKQEPVKCPLFMDTEDLTDFV